jgi:tetratricopeptide (TPR) repeat protein
VVPQKYRDNSVKFAKDNDQIAIFDAVTFENVNTGGSGNTKITREGEMLDATNLLIKGKPVDVAEIIRQNAENANLGEELTLPGIDVAKPLANVAKMTKADLKEHFPESVVPRARDEKIASDILDSPLYKQAKNHVAAVKQFASKLVEFARENEKHPAYQAGLKWYSEFVPKLHATYGKLAPIMAELLAATSPNEKPDSNFKMANEALVLYSKGHFDKQIAKFEQGLDMIKNNTWRAWLDKEAAAGKVKLPSDPTAATFINHWYDAHDIAPKKSNGKLFGMNSQAVMKVFARDWLQNTDGPKTQNFVQNLLGTGHEATIDVWADRTMRRMGYSGFKDRWRILPANGAGVSDADFAFGQEAFRAAAKELGILPDALQGALWFAEKNLWRENGWGRLDLGNYQAEFQKISAQNRGIESNLKKTAPKQTEDLFVVPRTLKPK